MRLLIAPLAATASFVPALQDATNNTTTSKKEKLLRCTIDGCTESIHFLKQFTKHAKHHHDNIIIK